MNERQNPYIGPRAFETGETLYGRERELRQLESLLIAERILLLHAPSGAGKTSLIQAGLIPDLINQDFNILPVIRVNLDLPGDLPIPETANRYLFSTLVAMEENLKAHQRLQLDELMALSLDEYMSQRQRMTGSPENDLLIFDQFEEILTTAPADREGKLAFFANLGTALRNRDRWALFSIRDDYLGALEPYLRPIPGQLEHHYRLDLLSPEAALQAIQNPAHKNGIDFTDSAAQKLVDDLRAIQTQQPDGTFIHTQGPHVEPVQLQVVCYRLWEAISEDATQIAPEDVQKVGSVDEALGEYYAASLNRIAETEHVEERILRQWFSEQLITPEGIRGQALSGRERSAGLSVSVLRQLENAHLIRGETRAGKLWYELAHDRLVEPVRQENARWFDANLSLLQKQAALWVNQKRPDGLLLTGAALEQAEHEARSLSLSSEELAFLEACRKLRQREQRDLFQRRVIAGALFLALVLLGAAVFFASAANTATRNAENQAATAQAASKEAVMQAKIAFSRELAARSLALRERNFSVAMLLSIEAFNLDSNIQTHTALMENAQVSPDIVWATTNLDARNIVVFSPDGKTLATGNADKSVALWDATTGTELRQIKNLSGTTNSVAFSPNGKLLASASPDTGVKLLDVKTGRTVGYFTDATSILSLAFNPDGTILATGDQNNSIVLWDVESQSMLRQFQTNIPAALAFSPDGQKLASVGGSDRTISIWDVTNGKSLAQWHGHDADILSLAFTPDGTKLATAGEDGNIILWEIASQTQIGNPMQRSGDTVKSIAISPQGNILAAGYGQGLVILWDLKSRQMLSQPLVGHSFTVWSVAFSPDGNRLASGSANGSLILWDLTTYNNPLGSISALAFSTDGNTLVSAGEHLLAWNIDKRQIEGGPFGGQISNINTVAFQPGKNILASGSDDGSIFFWDSLLHQQVGEALRSLSPVRSLAFSPNKGVLASGSDDGTVTLWDITTRKSTGTVRTGHDAPIQSLAFSPDGKILAAADGHGRMVFLWDVLGQPTLIRSFDTYNTANCLAYSPDGLILASGGWEGINLWDMTKSTPDRVAKTLVGHTASVTSLGFSTDGKLLVSGGADKAVMLWDMTTYLPLQQITNHTSKVSAVAFAPDGKLLVSSDESGRVVFVDMLPERWIEQLCRRAGRNFTAVEWAQYFGKDTRYHATCEQWPAEPEGK